MKVNIVVVTYNRKVLLKECLEALLNQTYKFQKLILIDNNSNDGTYEMLENNNFLSNKLIEYVKLDKNIGGAGGFYEGMKISALDDVDWTWIMDDDTIPEKQALENLVKYARNNKKEKVSYLSSYVYDIDKKAANIPQFVSDNSNEITAATFVSLLIYNKAIKEIGLPMKDYFIWGDDTEYTLRLTRYYGKAFFVKDSQVLHKRKNTGKLNILTEKNDTRIEFWYYMVRNNLNNYREYYGFKKFLRQLCYYIYLSLQCLFTPKVAKRFKKMKVLFKGIFAYLFKKYDYNAFKNRLDIHVIYNE